MIRIHLFDGETVDTYLHTRDQAVAAKDAGTDITVGGPKDSPYGPEDLLGDGSDPDLSGTMPYRTISASAIASIEDGV